MNKNNCEMYQFIWNMYIFVDIKYNNGNVCQY